MHTTLSGVTYFGGGFFLPCEDFGECSIVRSPPVLLLLFFLFFLFFFVEVEFSSRELIPLFMPESVHSGSAS